MSSYGIMGGVFDPIHNGHLLIAERAREGFGLESIVFVPTGRPAHKKQYSVTDAELRWQMTCLAIADNPRFEASRAEIDRPGISYAVDTIGQMLDSRPGEKPFFITGMDAVLEILTWHRASELPGLTEFVAATRPGYDLGQLDQKLPHEFVSRIHPLRVPLVEISSTQIRRRVRSGQSIRYLLPESVRQFVSDHNLYQESDEPQAS